jgi:hypothetical protein
MLFELRFLARRQPPDRWLVNLSHDAEALLPPQAYPKVPLPEDRLFIPTEYVPLWEQHGRTARRAGTSRPETPARARVVGETLTSRTASPTSCPTTPARPTRQLLTTYYAITTRQLRHQCKHLTDLDSGTSRDTCGTVMHTSATTQLLRSPREPC